MDKNKDVSGEVQIELDKPCTIKFAHFSTFRLSRKSDQLTDGKGEGFGYHQILIYIWAMLAPADLARFPEPEDLGQFVTLANIDQYAPQVTEAIALANPTAGEKKTRSKRGPSTASKLD
jgi:hypothetical protein